MYSGACNYVQVLGVCEDAALQPFFRPKVVQNRREEQNIMFSLPLRHKMELILPSPFDPPIRYRYFIHILCTMMLLVRFF